MVVIVVLFLCIVVDVCLGVMGDVGIVIFVDLNVMYFNVFKLVLVEEDLVVLVIYILWLCFLGLNDVYLVYLIGYKKFNDLEVFGFGFCYFLLGSIEFIDVNGELFVIG